MKGPEAKVKQEPDNLTDFPISFIFQDGFAKSPSAALRSTFVTAAY
jgi:hypothetical protein